MSTTTAAHMATHPDPAGPWRLHRYSARELQMAAAAGAARGLTAGRIGLLPGAGSDLLPNIAAPPTGPSGSVPSTPMAPLVRVRAANAGAGASTITLALADAADRAGLRTRVLDAAAPAWSGLLGASATELGATGRWRRGRRGRGVLIDRVGVPAGAPEQVPDPCALDGIDLTVLDTGWTTRELAATAADDGGCWLTGVPATAEVVVTRPDPMALGQAETVLAELAEIPAATSVIVVVVGVGHWAGRRSGRRSGRGVGRWVGRRVGGWAGPEFAAAGPRLLSLHEDQRVVFMPLLPARSMTGLGPAPLPKQLIAAAQRLLDRITTVTGWPVADPDSQGEPQPC